MCVNGFLFSLYNILVIVFHSRSHTQKRRFLFRGRYSFISDGRNNRQVLKKLKILAKYRVGRPIDGQPCGFIVDSSIKERGELYSPTYPGSYPQVRQFCSSLEFDPLYSTSTSTFFFFSLAPLPHSLLKK